MSYFSPHTPSQYLAQILDGLRQAAAAHASRRWSAAPVVILLCSYLNRVVARFEAHQARLLSGRLLSGRLLKPRVKAPLDNPAEPQLREEPQTPAKPRLSRRFGWLAQYGPEFRGRASQLRYLLCDPEVQALMAASPQAGRILRPLCRMLGIEPAADLPPSLYPPRPVRPPRPARPARRARRAQVARVAAAPAASPRPSCDRADWWMPKRA